jgi:hypothetical protein
VRTFPGNSLSNWFLPSWSIRYSYPKQPCPHWYSRNGADILQHTSDSRPQRGWLQKLHCYDKRMRVTGTRSVRLIEEQHVPIQQQATIKERSKAQSIFNCTNVPSGGLTLIVWTRKRGFYCKVQRRLPADMFLNESLPPKTPCGHHVHGRHGHGSPVKNRWRFSKFCRKYETLILQENEFKELTMVLFESLFQGLHILFYNIFGQTIFWSTARPWTSPKKRANDLGRSKFRQQG